MGDRAQIAVVDNNGQTVYLYTHWRGDEAPEILQRALSRKQRWDDSEYLARIIFCEMIKGDEASETGFGIGTGIHTDLDHPLIVVDTSAKTVTTGDKTVSFQKYIKE